MSDLFEMLNFAFRETIVAALVIGTLFVYFTKTGKGELKKYIYAGGITAEGCILAAIATETLPGAWNEFLKGLLFFLEAILLVALISWMHLTYMETRLYIEKVLINILDLGKKTGIFFTTFILIFSSSVEIMVFLLARNSGSTIIAQAVAGLVLAALLGYLFVKGNRWMDTGRFFKIPDMVLTLSILHLIIQGMFQWSEAGILKLTHIGMKIVNSLVKEPVYIAFTGLMLAFIVLLFLTAPWKKVEIAGLHGIEKRKALAAVRKERNQKTVSGIIAAIVIILFVSTQISALPSGIDPVPEKVSVKDGMIRIPVAGTSDGNLHKYVCDMEHDSEFCPLHGNNGTANARILAIQKSDGSVAVAYDACPLCGVAGYIQEGNELICKHCWAPINPDTVDIGGGCNPMLLNYTVNNDEIVIIAADAGQKADLFT